MEKINDMINVVDYLRQDLEPQDKKKGNKKKRGERERAAAAAPPQLLRPSARAPSRTRAAQEARTKAPPRRSRQKTNENCR